MTENYQLATAPLTYAAVCPHIATVAQTGYGICAAHHGELFQGQIEDASGKRRRCLVSLPCGSLRSRVAVVPNSSGQFRVDPPHKRKAKRVVERVFSYFGMLGLGGAITVTNNIEEGKGYGSSTADCVAAARAAAALLGRQLSQEEIAAVVVDAETASDNIMFQRAVLFAQREAIVLEDYGKPFPALEVFGVDTDESGAVDTLVHPPAEYHWREIYTFHVMVGALRRAFRTDDLNLLGRVATASSIINQRFLPKRRFHDIHALAARIGVLGLSVAHTGTVVSMLLDPADLHLEKKIDGLRMGFESLGMSKIFRFCTAEINVATESLA